MVQHQLDAAHFRTEHVGGALLSAAMKKEHSLTFSPLSPVAGTMEDHDIGDVSALAQSVELIAQIPNVIQKISCV